MWFRNYYVCIVRVKINNDELFCNAFPFQKIHMILFLDRLLDVIQCVLLCSTGNLSSCIKNRCK